MILINFLFGAFVLPLVVIMLHVLTNYLLLTIRDFFRLRHQWNDNNEVMAPKVDKTSIKPPDTCRYQKSKKQYQIPRKPLTIREIETIVNQIEFNDYE